MSLLKSLPRDFTLGTRLPFVSAQKQLLSFCCQRGALGTLVLLSTSSAVSVQKFNHDENDKDDCFLVNQAKLQGFN